METSKLNALLVNAIKKQIPKDDNLAKILMDYLCIGKEATYRRLRGEVPFTFAEAVIISRRFRISLDELINLQTNDKTI